MASKRIRAAYSKLKAGQAYKLEEALAIIKECATAKFDESIDFSVNLGVDARKSDQIIRGSIVLPKGSGKKVRVAVFTQGANVKAATDAGADIVGFEDLAEKIKAGELNFDVVIASPDAMRVVGQLGQVLGPRGLMPNPKDGTVSPNIGEAVRNAKAGQVRYRADKNGILHATVGRASFTIADLKENVNALVAALKKAKPSSSKGVYMRKVSLSSTMGPGVAIDLATID